MSHEIFYTKAERTEHKYTLGDIYKAIYARVPEHLAICINHISRNPGYEHSKFTLVELNEIAERVVEDTLYYQVRK